MRKRSHVAGYLLGLALVLVSLASAALAQSAAPKGNGKIAFVSSRVVGPIYYENAGVSVMNPDGSGRESLTATQILCPQPNRPPGYGCGPNQLDYSPAWSPDGTQIAFNRSLPVPEFSSETGIFVMDADGSNQRRLPNGINSFSPAWSPDGTRIAFVGPHLGDYYFQVYVMNADGSGQRPIGRGVDPAWSPDGSKLAFASGGLYLMNPDGSGRTQITAPRNPSANLVDYDWGPAWSPDGTRIIFNRSVGCDWDDSCESITIWTVNADGSNPAKLANIEAYGRLAWSPDGTKIVFSANGDLFTMEADGSNVTNITNTPDESEWLPSWQAVALAPPPVNLIDDPQFFVTQHYRDFLSREPDAGGLAYWTNEITQCGSNAACINRLRADVSAAFFIEQEFQETGYFVYRLYKASFGRQPNYIEFTSDRSRIIGGANLEASKRAFADEWVQRPACVAAYPTTMSNTEFVNKLFDFAGLTASHYDSLRQQEILAMNGGRSRALVLRDVIEIPDFKNIPDEADPRYSELKQTSQYNPAFVLMQYFGYLRRDVDPAGYAFWLDIVNNREPNNYRAMVCAFITSREYQLRFGSEVTRTNAVCGS